MYGVYGIDNYSGSENDLWQWVAVRIPVGCDLTLLSSYVCMAVAYVFLPQ